MRQLSLILFLSILLIDNSYSQVINEFFVKGVKKEILIVPVDYQMDQTMPLLGKVKSGDPTFLEESDFKTQLDRISQRAAELGGNIAMITTFDNQKLREAYELKAKVFKCADYKKYKDSMMVKKEKETFSGIVLYRPNYTYSLNDLHNFTVIVNNQEYLVKRNTKQFIKIEKDATVEIRIKDSEDKITVDFKPGETYYVRCLVYFPDTGFDEDLYVNSIPLAGYIPRIHLMSENGQGEIESKTIIAKK